MNEKSKNGSLVLQNGAQLPTKFDFEDEDMKGYTNVRLNMTYAQIRNTDKADESGKVIQPRGQICFRDDRPDVGMLDGIIFVVREGAVCFDNGQVICKSQDRISGNRVSEQRNLEGQPREVFGFCGDCFYQRHGGENNGRKCRIDRPLGFLQVENDRITDLFIFNLSPGSEGPWREYEDLLCRYIAKASGRKLDDIKQIPHHRFLVRISPQYVKPKRKGITPYYAAQFESLGVVEGELRKAVKARRDELMAIYAQVRETQELKEEDYLGTKNGNGEKDEEVSFP